MHVKPCSHSGWVHLTGPLFLAQAAHEIQLLKTRNFFPNTLRPKMDACTPKCHCATITKCGYKELMHP